MIFKVPTQWCSITSIFGEVASSVLSLQKQVSASMIGIFRKRKEDFFIFVPSYKSFLHLTIWCVRGRSTHQVLRSGIATAPPFGRLCENMFAWLTFAPGFKSFLHLSLLFVSERSAEGPKFRHFVWPYFNETIKILITMLEYLSLSNFCSVRNSYSSYCLFN